MFTLTIDLQALFDINEYQDRAQNLAEQYSGMLAKATYGKILELADQKLHSRKELFVDNLFLNQTEPGQWSVILGKRATWIEEGTLARNMLADLLKSRKAKTGKNGKKFIRVPFNHTKGGNLTPAQQRLKSVVMDELRERDLDSPQGGKRSKKRGSFDVNDRPLSTDQVKIGSGPKGQVAQGSTGIPVLKGVQVYQKYKAKTGKVSINALTFRTASEDSPTSAWNHPGNDPVGILGEAADWAEKEAQSYVDKILKRL